MPNTPTDKPLEKLSDEQLLADLGERPDHPEAPILLGAYPLEQAEAHGAFQDPALDDVPELRGWGTPYRDRRMP